MWRLELCKIIKVGSMFSGTNQRCHDVFLVSRKLGGRQPRYSPFVAICTDNAHFMIAKTDFVCVFFV